MYIVALYHWTETEAAFIPLSFSELVSNAVHLYGPPVANNSWQWNAYYRLFPCINFTCSGNITKLLYVSRNTPLSRFSPQPPSFHLLRKYQGPEYCNDTDPSSTDCVYYQWLTLNQSVQHPHSVYTNDMFEVYEVKLSTNNSFENGDILGVHYSSQYTSKVFYQKGGAYCNTLQGGIMIHSYGGFQILYQYHDPVLPYIAIETGQHYIIILRSSLNKCFACRYI